MEWWYVLGIMGVLVGAVVYVRDRQQRLRQRPRPDDHAAPRNYAGEREDTRLGDMSAEDRAWEQGSLQRNRDRQAGQATQDGTPAATPPERADRGARE